MRMSDYDRAFSNEKTAIQKEKDSFESQKHDL